MPTNRQRALACLIGARQLTSHTGTPSRAICRCPSPLTDEFSSLRPPYDSCVFTTHATTKFPVRIFHLCHLKWNNNLCLLTVILLATGSVALGPTAEGF